MTEDAMTGAAGAETAAAGAAAGAGGGSGAVAGAGAGVAAGADAGVVPAAEVSFKEGLTELDGIVRALEGNQLELEDSIKSYERGVALLGALQAKLDEAQQKVTVLMGELEPAGDEVDGQLS